MLARLSFLLALLSGLAASFAAANPVILFQDRFETAPAGGLPQIPPWTTISMPHPEHALTVRGDSQNLLGGGPNNRFLEFRDPVSTGSLMLGASQLLAAEVVTLSFLLHEPSNSGLPGQLTLQAFAGTGTASTANRVQVFHFINGNISGSPSVPYGMDRTLRVDIVLNNSASAVTYRNGSRTVASGRADIWIDGLLVAPDYVNDRQVGPGPIRSFDFRTFTSQRQLMYLDNVTVFEGAVVGAAFVPPVGEPTFPLVLQPNREVNEIFGYNPDFLPNEISFDSLNRPYLRSRTSDIDQTRHIQTIRDGIWVERPFIEAIKKVFPTFDYTFRAAGWQGARVVFDAEDRMYTAMKIRLTNGSYRNVLLFSRDYGETFTAHDLQTGGDVALENFTGHNRLEGPPFIVIQHRRIATHPDPWADYHEMRIVQPRLVDGVLQIPPHIHVSNDLISIGQHSGGTSFSATLNGKTHFAWIEVTDDNVPGSPTYVATYDHATNTVGPKVLVAYAPPKNNSHNRPGVVLDSEGYIHVVTGSHHGENFFHVRSQQPNNAYDGWTTPQPVWDKGWRNSNGNGPERGGQTYVSLVCDADDTLHLAFRQWRYADQYFARDPYYAALSYQRKPKNGAWSAPVPLVIPERGIYAIYYQKLSIDHRGRLFLSASYYDNTLGESPALGQYLRRMLLVSGNAGDSWKLANTGDLDTRWFFTPFELWQRRFFSPAQLSENSLVGSWADPSGDGIPNLLKAALDLDPWAPARASLPQPFVDEAGRLAMEFWRAVDLGAHLFVEASHDLVTWSADEVEFTAEPVIGNRQLVRFRLSPEASAQGRTFLRLRVEDSR
jgi:hypothetical protein